MDLAGLQLLLVVLIVGTSVCARRNYDELKKEIIQSLKETEIYPWQSELNGRKIWNNEVQLKGCWVNYHTRFTISCSEMKKPYGVYYRAILYNYKYWSSNPVMSWDVKSCENKLLDSFSVYQFWTGYLMYIVENGKCKEIIYSPNILRTNWKISSSQDHCADERTKRKNIDGYRNGWKSVNPKCPEACSNNVECSGE